MRILATNTSPVVQYPFACLCVLLAAAVQAQPAKTPAPGGQAAPAAEAEAEAEAGAEAASGYGLRDGVLSYAAAADAPRVEVPLPAPAVALHVRGERAYVALGAAGAAVVVPGADGVPVIERIVPVSHGEAVGFLLVGEQVWLQVAATSAVRLDGAAGGGGTLAALPAQPQAAVVAPSAAAHDAEAQAATERGASITAPLRILRVFGGQAVLDQGSNAGLRAGDRLRVTRPERLQDDGGVFEGRQAVATLVVERVAPDSARAQIWRGDEVRPGDTVDGTATDVSASLHYPRQLADFLEAEVHVRPILNVGETGFGVLLGGNATYYARDYYLGVRAEPLGVGRTQSSTAFSQTTMLEGGYNSRPFAIGLGIGVSSAYSDLRELFDFGFGDTGGSTSRGWQPGQPEYGPWRQELEHALSLGQRVRLGAQDGLNLTVYNTLLYFGADDSEGESRDAGFTYGGTNVRLTIPLAMRADLFFEGGGGIVGYGYGAVGVFGWLHGNGGPGSFGVMASAGGAGVWGERIRRNYRFGGTERESIEVGGPMVSFGLRYRR